MKLPPHEIVAQSVDRIELVLTVMSDAPAFAGHFPNQPVLPGVVQLDWALRFAGEYLALPTPVATDFQVKFQHVITPGRITLVVNRHAANGLLTFTYAQDEKPCSSGKIKQDVA